MRVRWRKMGLREGREVRFIQRHWRNCWMTIREYDFDPGGFLYRCLMSSLGTTQVYLSHWICGRVRARAKFIVVTRYDDVGPLRFSHMPASVASKRRQPPLTAGEVYVNPNTSAYAKSILATVFCSLLCSCTYLVSV